MVVVVVVVIVYLSIHLSIYLSTKTKQFCETSSQLWNLTPSKTKQFCETSSIFELDNSKNEAILLDFLQKWNVECRAGGLVPLRFAIFPLHLSKVLRLPRKSDARSYEVLHLSRKIIFPKLKMLQNATRLRKSAPSPPNISDEHVSCTAPATENPSLQILFKCPTPAIVFLKCYKTPTFCSLLTRCTISCTFHAKRHLNVQKCSVPLIFPLLTWKCASRHNGVHFFDISTSKSGPNMRRFVHFDLEMCFAPQRRALFRHRNFQKCSEHEVFLAFSLANVLCAPTACNFSSLIWPAGSAPAALASLLFDPPEPQIIGKTQCFVTFLPFRAPGSSFF